MLHVDPIRTWTSKLSDRTRNRRQASMFLLEVSRQRCKAAAEKITLGRKLLERSKAIAQRSRNLCSR